MVKAGLNKIAILLSTYNGEKYLSKQLESLINQTYKNFIIYIRDDGSSYNMIKIINHYISKYPDFFVLIKDNLGNLGFQKSFIKIVTIANADYYFFCDQDDIWYENKLSIFLQKFEKKENNIQKSILIYSNFDLINESNQIIGNNILKKTPPINQINNGAFANLVQGFLMAFNNLAKSLFLFYKNYHLHDELMFILTSVYGKIIKIKKTLVKYRIHNNNTIGLKKNKINWNIYMKDILKFMFNNKGYCSIKLSNYILYS